jgi:cephalosporin-C deacetylase-like acetyl esterase
MPREDIEFKTSDNVTLRGWFCKPTGDHEKLPCLVMSHGFSALKEMDLDVFAEYFTSKLALACLVYDNRSFGTSDAAPGQPRHEIIPSAQCSDISDAITYAQTRSDVDANKIGLWGSSYSGGNVLWVGGIDKRVKAVLSQVPLVSGWDTFQRLIRPDFVPHLNALFQGGMSSHFEVLILLRPHVSPGSRSLGKSSWEDRRCTSSCRPRPNEAVCFANGREFPIFLNVGSQEQLEE